MDLERAKKNKDTNKTHKPREREKRESRIWRASHGPRKSEEKERYKQNT